MKHVVNQFSKGKLSRTGWWVIAVLSFLILLIGAWLLLMPHTVDAPTQQASDQTSQELDPEQSYEAPNLQPTVEAWAKKYPATYGIVIYDNQSGTKIAQLNEDTVMFAASLYKIFVAYLALEDFQTGVQDQSDTLISGYTKKECVDLMIRESNSPCGEAMMADMGQLNLNDRVKAKDINNTTFNGIQTTAADSAIILKLLLDGNDLTEENTAFLRDAMLDQSAMYRRGLAKGAPEGKWETKVGWNLDINYHDIGILTMPDGREFVVAILGQGSGSPDPIADFASTIYAALKN